MPIVELTVADDDVFRWGAGKLTLTTLSSVVVTSTLDGDTVVASIEIAVLYQYAVATLRVAAVTIRSVIINMYATNGNVCGKQRGRDTI